MRLAWTLFAALAVAGCGSDRCEGEAPAAEIAVAIDPGVGAQVERLEVALTIGGATYERTYETSDQLADGATAFSVDLGAMRVTDPTPIVVAVVAFDATDAVASGSTQQTLTVDACNRLAVTLGPAGGCGDGTRDPGEECDGADFADASCLQFGLRAGDGQLSCDGACLLDASTCAGGVIDSVAQLVGAVEDARASNRPSTIRIEAGTYDLTAPLVLSGAAVTLQPLDGPVVLRGDVAIRVEASGSAVQFLSFEDTTTAARIIGDGVTFEGNDVRNLATAAASQVHVTGADAIVRSNRFRSGPPSTSAIRIEGALDARVRMNVIDGAYTVALDLSQPDGSARVDHNSVRSASGTAVRLDARANVNLCLRNNALQIAAGATGYDVSMQTRLKTCDAVSSGDNAIGGAGTLCTGRCTDCDNSGALCDPAVDPAFTDDGLCLPAGSPLIDAARDVGADLIDVDAAAFRGQGPDIGARESMSSRAFGGVASICQ